MKKIILIFLLSLISSAGFSQALDEGFEAAPATADASGIWTMTSGDWLVRDNRTNTGQNWKVNTPPAAFPANTGTKAAFIDRENTGQGILAEEWLITPLVTLPTNAYQFRFFTRQTSPGDTGTLYQIRVSSSADRSDLSSYTVLQQYTETQLSTLTSDQLDYEEKVINLPFTGARFFAFVKVFTQPGTAINGDRWLVDDVKIVERCPNVTGLNVNGGVSATTATLGWTGTSPQYQVEYGPSGFTQGTGTVFTGITTNTFTLGNGTPASNVPLTPSTAYQFYVRSICPLNNGDWIGPFNFVTASLGSTCAGPIVVPGLPYSDTGNTLQFGNNISAASPGNSGCGTTGNFLAGNDVVYSYTVPANGQISITMDPQGAANTGMFVYSSCANIGSSCIAGVGNATGNVREIAPLNVTAGQTLYIVLSSNGTPQTFGYTLVIQQFTCPRPTNGATVPGTVGLTDAQLSWSNGSGSTATSWQVVVQTAGSTIPTGPGVSTTNNTTFQASTGFGGPLTAATNYQFWVRADCGDGTFSAWSGPYLFHTNLCEAANQCTYTFVVQDTFGDSWNGATMQVLQNGILVTTLTGPTAAQGTSLVNVPITLCDGFPLEVIYNAGGTFPTEPRLSIVNGFNQQIFTMTGPGTVGSTLYSGSVDCVNPLCLAPSAPTVPVASITASGATINWTTSGVPTTGWEIYVTPTGSPAPNDTTTPSYTVTGTTSSYTIASGLTADTCYDVYVRSVCSVNSPSTWTTATVTFCTTPTCPRPTNITVSNTTLDSATVTWNYAGPPAPASVTYEVLVLPSPSTLPLPTTGWIAVTGTTTNLTGLNAATNYDVYVRTICPGNDVGQAAGPTTFHTNVCDPINQCNYIFTVTDTFGDSWNGAVMQVLQNNIVVATITGPTAAQGTTPINVNVPLCTDLPFDLFWQTAGTFPGEVRVSITNTFGQVLFNLNQAAPGLAGTVIYHDDKADCLNPKCLPPTGLGSNPSIFSAELTWTATNLNTAWEVYLVPTGGTPPTAATAPTYIASSVLPFPATGLDPSTTYDYYVRAICDANSPSIWVGPSTFTTLPTCPEPINLAATVDETTHSATLTWQEVGPATSWEVSYAPSGTGVPTGPGTIVTGTPTFTTPPGLEPGIYEFYVRATCSSSDISTWAGPYNFYVTAGIITCASVEIQPPVINGEPITGSTVDFCNDGTSHCIDLAASFTPLLDTTNYNVLPIAFAPPFPFVGGTELPINIDDIWSAPFPLPFTFCFYGNNYTSLNVGSNGVIGFNGYAANDYCNWPFTQTIPNTGFPILNAIYGVYQDMNPAVSSTEQISVNYQVIGNAPCRAVVVNYFQLPQFSCGTSVGLQTSQIVLYETSNIIEVYVKDRTVCEGWNSGSGLIGLQNQTGTLAVTPPGRNTGPWEAHNEAWRFSPNGASNVSFSWLQGGAPYSTETNINVCVTETTLMTAQAVYTGCGGQVTTKTADILLRVNDAPVIDPIDDVIVCENSYQLPELPAGQAYYSASGGNAADLITNTLLTSNQTVYVFASTDTTPACTSERSFNVTIGGLVAPIQSDLSDCTSVILPPLPTGGPVTFNYYTDIDGGGTQLPEGAEITTSQAIYIFGANDNCFGQSSFNVTIGEIPAYTVNDVTQCGTYTLPFLTNPDIYSYYTLPGGPAGGGTLLPALTVLNGTQTVYVWGQDGDCTSESSFVVNLSDSITPDFTPIADLCLNSPAITLSTTSNNGVTGIWSPSATVDTGTAGTFTYTFQPNTVDFPCAVSTSLTVNVQSQITPTFDAIPNPCLNSVAPTLPAQSTESIPGTWSPSNIDTSIVGATVYTFTPDTSVSPCAVPSTLTVTVVNSITPTFTQIAPICQNAAAPALPTVSDEGITGSWNPATIDTATAGTTTYTFNPDLATFPCATTATMDITITPEVTPTFNPIGTLCLNSTAPALPSSSTNGGITGTWNPPTIDTSVAGTFTYTFTPDASTACATTATLTVAIGSQLTPDFATPLTFCQNDVAPALQLQSPNGVTGTWSVASIDTTTPGTSTITFTPDAGQCATSQTITINVTPQITPIFDPIAPFCSGATAPTLFTESTNGITGIWTPAVIDNQNSATYTFIPTAGQCATTTTLSVTVTPSVVPTFNAIAPFCVGGTAPVLQLTSNEGVTGTWNPATVSNTQIGDTNYTFTPDAGQCASPVTIAVTVNDVPEFTITSQCEGGQYVIRVNPTNGFNPDDVTYTWTLNSVPVPNSDSASIVVNATGIYTVTVSNSSCPSAPQDHAVTNVTCIIQKGISPRGTGSGDGKNDFFDLVGRDVRKLEIFNRYGTKVYSQVNYTNQWYGQSDKGNELPDGTYYYVIEHNSSDSDTGWIYINREQ